MDMIAAPYNTEVVTHGDASMIQENMEVAGQLSANKPRQSLVARNLDHQSTTSISVAFNQRQQQRFDDYMSNLESKGESGPLRLHADLNHSAIGK